MPLAGGSRLLVVDPRALIADAPRKVWSDPRGSMTFIRVPPRMGIIVFEGRLGDGAVLGWEQHFPWMLSEDMCLFCDAAGLVRTTALVTATGTSLLAKSRKQILEFHTLVGNTIVETLAKAVNMSIGGFIRLYRDHEAFERERDRVLLAQHALLD